MIWNVIGEKEKEKEKDKEKDREKEKSGFPLSIHLKRRKTKNVILEYDADSRRPASPGDDETRGPSSPRLTENKSLLQIISH